MPCNACTYCIKHHEHWLGFREHVDKVVPLANMISPKVVMETDGPEVVTESAIGVTPRGDQVDDKTTCKLKQVNEMQVELGDSPRVNNESQIAEKVVDDVSPDTREYSRGNQKVRKRRRKKSG